MEHSVPLDDRVGILEQLVTTIECPEVRLSAAEDHRHDVHRHSVDEPH